jgi:hypothetical protein
MFMEQQLINALMKLISKAGGGSMIKDLIQQVDQNGNPKVWTPGEISSAVQFINWQIENFGSAEANAIVETLQKKYNVQAPTTDTDFTSDESLPSVPGVHGLR